VLQAICDGGMSFIDISVGWPGSLHDARIFRLSAIGQMLETDGLQNYHILGDTAYPVKPYLVMPFCDTRDFSADECHFNTIQSASRTIIQCAFARVNRKFRRLKYLDMDKVQLVTTAITATSVVHNFILQHDSQSSMAAADDDYSDSSICSAEHNRITQTTCICLQKVA